MSRDVNYDVIIGSWSWS